MRKAIIFILSITSLISLLPNVALAASCKCLETISATASMGGSIDLGIKIIPASSPATCQYPPLTNHRIDGELTYYTNCQYCNDNDGKSCNNSLKNIDRVCSTDNDCKLVSVGVTKCILGTCAMDDVALDAFNKQVGTSPIDLKKPTLEISIPGISFSDMKSNIDAEGNIHISYIAEYLIAAYKFAVAAGSMVAVIVIILNGFRVMVSAGGEEKNHGIQNIGKAVTGLFILWSSFLLLNTINPALTQFKSLGVQYIQPVSGPPEDFSAPDNLPTVPAPTGLVTIQTSGLLKTKGGEKQARPELVTALEKAVNESNITVVVNSAFRTPDQQYNQMQDKCGCPPVTNLPANVAKTDWTTICTACVGCQASCALTRVNGVFQGSSAGHMVGNAVDVSSVAENSNVACDVSDANVRLSEGVVLTPLQVDKTCVPRQQQLLIKAMLNNGFCVGLKDKMGLRESWHFEYTKNSLPRSPFCTDDVGDPNIQKLYYVVN